MSQLRYLNRIFLTKIPTMCATLARFRRRHRFHMRSCDDPSRAMRRSISERRSQGCVRTPSIALFTHAVSAHVSQVTSSSYVSFFLAKRYTPSVSVFFPPSLHPRTHSSVFIPRLTSKLVSKIIILEETLPAANVRTRCPS